MDCEKRTYVVDLVAKTCECRINNGIPCKHVVSCISKQVWRPEAFIHPYYNKETYLKAYEGLINALPREHDRERTFNDPI